MPENKNVIDPNLSFEDTQKEIEEIVSKMQSGGFKLSESIDAYDRGMALIRHAREILEGYQKKLEEH